MLQETWMSEAISLPGYAAFSIPAHRSNKEGRPKAGISILISNSSCLTPIRLNSCEPLAQAIYIEIMKASFILVNVYIPPLEKLSQTEDSWTRLINYISDLEQKFPSAFLIIVGDFNAKLGPNDTVLCNYLELNPDEVCSDTLSFFRVSKDKELNRAAHYLINLCLPANQILLNGRSSGDMPGEFTFRSRRGASAIDYIIIPSALKEYITKFQVGERTESDHYPLTLELTSPICHDYLSSASSTGQTTSYRWSSKSEEQALEFFTNNASLALRQRMIETCSIHKALHNYSILVTQSAELCLNKFSHQKSLLNDCAHSWFDQHCRFEKQKLRKLFGDCKRLNTSEGYTAYFEARKEYFNLTKEKKQLALSKTWDNLAQALKSRDNCRFWKIVGQSLGGSRTAPHSSIKIESWTEYFSTILHDPNSLPHGTDETLSPGLVHWPPVGEDEIRSLIFKLRRHKSPGPDGLPSEIFQKFINYWAPLFASLFTKINSSGTFPPSWKEAIVVPIFKKGDPNSPANYRPISLLSVPGKIYASHLRSKLIEWSANKVGPEQIGFTMGKSTLDHVLTLYHLAAKYTWAKQGKLYAAFLDLQTAFDSIPRSRLWEKLSEMGMDSRLLHLIRNLYTNTSCQIRGTSDGKLSVRIPTNKGVKQGCVLAPHLFNLYLADLAGNFTETRCHAPRLGGSPVPLLLYADDAVLLSCTKVGFKALLHVFTSYCNQNHLKINFIKSKIVVFAKSRKLTKWKMGEHHIEQVHHFKYLGVHFHHTLKWTLHWKQVANRNNLKTTALARFFFSKGGQNLPAAIKNFQTMLIPKLFYGLPVWGTDLTTKAESLQSAFLRRLLGLPNCVSALTIYLETGATQLASLAWLHIFKFWLRLTFRAQEGSLVYSMLSDNFLSPWSIKINNKLKLLGLSTELLENLEEKQIYNIIRQRILDIDHQEIVAGARRTCSPIFFKIYPPVRQLSEYFTTLPSSHLKRFFMLARLNILPTAVTKGRYTKTPHHDRLCSCSAKTPETVEHVLLSCEKHYHLRERLINPLMRENMIQDPSTTVTFLLSDHTPQITEGVAKFLYRIFSNDPGK